MENQVNNPSNSITKIQTLDKIESSDCVEIGKWYILDTTKTTLFNYGSEWKKPNEVTTAEGGVLVVADAFESNLVILKSNAVDYRVLNKNLGYVLSCITETEAQNLIQGRGKEKQALIIEAQVEIKEVIAQINMAGAQTSGSTELIVATKDALLEQSRVLTEVHGKRIDELNNSIKKNVEDLHAITSYYALPAMVGISKLSKSKAVITDKLRELSLYGGLNEQETIVSTGGVASEDKPVHIYQNLKHMDVECIIGYQSGGIDVRSVKDFNEWLAKPANRNRVMPADKSIVAIKIRKHPNARIWEFGANDNATYLYLRNGENIKAIETKIEINGTLLATENDFAHSFYAKKVGSWADISANFAFLSKNEYEHLATLSEQAKPLYLNTMLDAYRLRLDYLVKALAYAEHKQRVIGDANHDTHNEDIITKKGVMRATALIRSGLDKARVSHNKDINETKERIQTITACIKDGFVDPKFDFPHTEGTWFGILNIETPEIGFIDAQGNRHLMQLSEHDYIEGLKAIKEKYDQLGLYFPNPEKHRHSRAPNNPFAVITDLLDYELINDTNYFFDDIKSLSWDRYKRQNDLAILVQGLFDRSTFFGHTKVSLFQEGFEDKVKLVYDLEKGLYSGDMPDFKSYLTNGRIDSKKGDVFFGHKKIWQEEQDEKASRHQFYDRIDIPKYLKADSVIKKRDGRTVVKFKWQTEHPYWSKAKTPARNNVFECDIDELINVSHYKLNDCEVFTKDPRCRDRYPEWGEFMMAAETYHQEGDNSNE